MIRAICVLCLILCSTPPSFSFLFECQTGVAVKKGIQDYTDSMAIGAKSFKDLVKKSKVFVDKTLFIKQLLYHSDKVTVILSPSKWGKSINLDMLKTYFEIQTDAQGSRISPLENTTNYRLMRKGEIVLENGRVQRLQTPLLIQQYSFMMEQFQGQHPVIYITFKDVVGSCYDDIKNRIYLAIGRTFNQHKYLLNTLGEEDAEEFQCIIHYEMCDGVTPMVTRILLLCKFLYNHFNSSLIVLMDDYDAPLMSAFQRDDFPEADLKELLRVYVSLLGYIFEGNPYLMKGVIVGVFEIGGHFFLGVNNYTVYNIAKHPSSLLQYFGFHRQNVDKLFQLHNITGALAEKAHRWYGGYVASHINELRYYPSFYNPSSIAHFLRYRKITSYWAENGNIDTFDNIIAFSPYTRKAFFKLLSKTTRSATNQLILHTGHFKIINDLLHKKQLHHVHYDHWGAWSDTTHLDLFVHIISFFMEYLLAKGFFATQPVGLLEFNEAYIPNNEIAFEIAKRLMHGYKKKFHIRQDILEDIATGLLEFLRNDDLRNPIIERSLENLYAECTPLIDEVKYDITYGDDNPSFSIFNCITLQMQCTSQFEVDVYYRQILGPDIVVVDNTNKRGAVIEFTFVSGIKISYLMLNRSEKFEYVFNNFTNLKKLKFIAINILPNNTVNILARMKNKGQPKPVPTTTTECPNNTRDFRQDFKNMEEWFNIMDGKPMFY